MPGMMWGTDFWLLAIVVLVFAASALINFFAPDGRRPKMTRLAVVVLAAACLIGCRAASARVWLTSSGAESRTHAGIVKVRSFTFSTP
jgi:hypothetical protein